MRIMSPGTRSREGMSVSMEERRTVAVGAERERRAARVCSAAYSWEKVR